MERKSIKTLAEMPDEVFFKEGITIEDIQVHVQMGERRAMLLARLAALCKELVNAGVAIEDLLSEEGMINVSAAVYALEWSALYYAAETERMKRRDRGYWHCLYDALLNR